MFNHRPDCPQEALPIGARISEQSSTMESLRLQWKAPVVLVTLSEAA
jgi:hypothetical protein